MSHGRGVPKSPEHRERIRQAMRRRVFTPEHLAHMSAAGRAAATTDAGRAQILRASAAGADKTRGVAKSEEQLVKMRDAQRRRWANPANRERQSQRVHEAMLAKYGPPDLEDYRKRRNYDMKVWRRTVLERDGHRCIECGATDRLEADHILPFRSHPDLRYDPDNGRTLCSDCHKKTATWGNRYRKAG